MKNFKLFQSSSWFAKSFEFFYAAHSSYFLTNLIGINNFEKPFQTEKKFFKLFSATNCFPKNFSVFLTNYSNYFRDQSVFVCFSAGCLKDFFYRAKRVAKNYFIAQMCLLHFFISIDIQMLVDS